MVIRTPIPLAPPPATVPSAPLSRLSRAPWHRVDARENGMIPRCRRPP